MGILSVAQKLQFEVGPVRFRQEWSIYTPRASGSTTRDAVVIDDCEDPDDRRTVLDPGERVVEGWNQSLAITGALSSGQYRIVCSNATGLFYPSVAGNFWYNWTGTYQASPVECHLGHKLYLFIDSSGSWSEIAGVTYRGAIQGCPYDDNNLVATIEAVSLAAVALQYEFTTDDGTTSDTGMNVLWP